MLVCVNKVVNFMRPSQEPQPKDILEGSAIPDASVSRETFRNLKGVSTIVCNGLPGNYTSLRNLLLDKVDRECSDEDRKTRRRD